MRALEVAHTKISLKNWIDLIFGYKQSGEPAETALNMFYETTYESYYSRAFERCSDSELEKIVSFIFNFGQTPTRLFSREHPRPLKADPNLFSKFLSANIIELVQVNVQGIVQKFL